MYTHAHTHLQRSPSSLKWTEFIFLTQMQHNIHWRLKTVVCLLCLLQVLAPSCSTLCTKAFEVFLWTHQISLMLWYQCQAPPLLWE